MTDMKRGLAVLLIGSMVLLCGCGGQESVIPDAMNTPNTGETVGGIGVPVETEVETEPQEESALSLTHIPKPADAISVGENHFLGLRKDGTVVAAGRGEYGECDVDSWTDVIKVRGIWRSSIGLKKDGTMVMAGNAMDESDSFHQILEWTDIVDFDAADSNMAALKSDGTVVGVGYRSDTAYVDWTRVVKVVTNSSATVGLREDGTVLYHGSGSKGYNKELITSWTDIADIDIHDEGVIALKTDGTVLIAYNKEIDISGWKNVVAIFAGEDAMAIAEDGTIYTSADYAADWTDIIAYDSDDIFALALRVDGTIVTTSDSNSLTGQSGSWTNIGIPE